MTKPAATARPLGEIAVTPRSLSEYRDMFLLTDADLTAGPILDCPAGASPFGAQVRARVGAAVVSVDPAYHAPREEIVTRSQRDLARIAEWMAAYPDNFDWSYLGSPGACIQGWEVASDLFAADYMPDGERYVAAALPTLPFPDGHFRLTLSSHLLFVYPDHLTFDDHVGGLLELVRVTRGEVRLFPLVSTDSTVYPRLEEVRTALAERGVRTEIRIAACAYQPGANHMIACWRGQTA